MKDNTLATLVCFVKQDSTNHDWLRFHQCIDNAFLSELVHSSTNCMFEILSVCDYIGVPPAVPTKFSNRLWSANLQASQSVYIFHHACQTTNTRMCGPVHPIAVILEHQCWCAVILEHQCWHQCHPGVYCVLLGDNTDTPEQKATSVSDQNMPSCEHLSRCANYWNDTIRHFFCRM